MTWPMGLRGTSIILLASLAATATADDAYDRHVRQVVAAMQQGAVAPQKLREFDTKAVPELIRLIPRIEDPGVLYSVGERLEELDARRSIQPIIETLARRFAPAPNIRYHPAVKVLDQWGAPAVGPLIRGIASPNSRIRYYCAFALAEKCVRGPSCDKRIPPVFCRLAKTGDPGLQIIAARALLTRSIYYHIDRNGGGGGFGEVVDIAGFRAVIELSLDADYEAMPTIIQGVNRFLSARVQAPALTVPNGDVDPNRIVAESAKLEALFKSKDPAVRMAVLAMWHVAGSMSVISALVDESADVRQVALKAMVDRIDGGDIPAIAVHSKSMRPEVRAAAAQALGLSRNLRALPFLQPMLKDPHPSVRETAKEACDRIWGAQLFRDDGKRRR
jgi:hypothetical protein